MSEQHAGARRWPAWGIVALALGLWVLAAAAAAGARLAGELPWALEPGAQRLLASYAVHLPAALLALGGTAALLVGAIRWAQHGPCARQTARDALPLLEQIHSRLMLSETAKRIAYREQDLNLLRQTIDQDIRQGDFDAALVLVGELTHTFGDREQAEQYRERIEQARSAQRDARVAEALKEVDQLIERHHYEAAAGEIVKLQRVHGDLPAVRQAQEKVGEARRRYKHELEQQFLDAAERGDTDAAMELLWALDHYLTEAEAEPLRETARGVIGKRRDNLGVQFRKAVRDRDWHNAVRAGEQIIEDFPNTRMAEEVRQHLDVLRQRAAQQRAAQAAGP